MPQRFDEFKAENDVGADDDTTVGSIVSCRKFANHPGCKKCLIINLKECKR